MLRMLHMCACNIKTKKNGNWLGPVMDLFGRLLDLSLENNAFPAALMDLFQKNSSRLIKLIVIARPNLSWHYGNRHLIDSLGFYWAWRISNLKGSLLDPSPISKAWWMCVHGLYAFHKASQLLILCDTCGVPTWYHGNLKKKIDPVFMPSSLKPSDRDFTLHIWY